MYNLSLRPRRQIFPAITPKKGMSYKRLYSWGTLPCIALLQTTHLVACMSIQSSIYWSYDVLYLADLSNSNVQLGNFFKLLLQKKILYKRIIMNLQYHFRKAWKYQSYNLVPVMSQVQYSFMLLFKFLVCIEEINYFCFQHWP